jgi:hypothetical protein
MAKENGLKPIRTSANGNEIFALPLGTIEGTKTTFKTGKTGFRMFGKVIVDGKQHQVVGNLVQLGE